MLSYDLRQEACSIDIGRRVSYNQNVYVQDVKTVEIGLVSFIRCFLFTSSMKYFIVPELRFLRFDAAATFNDNLALIIAERLVS